jgi:transposase
MAKRFVTCSLEQPYLLPPNLQDWLPESHLARFIADVVRELDLSAILDDYQRADGRGKCAYHPEMMTRLLLYAYAIGQPSSRQIERATYTDLAYRYLSANQHPDHDTIANFRQRHLDALANLFVQVLRICQKAGLVKLGYVAIDGTKIKAQASRHRSVSYGRLSEKEQYWQNRVAELLAKAAAIDSAESKRANDTGVLPPDLAHAQTRLAKIRAAKQTLEQEAQQKLADANTALPGGPKPVGRPPKSAVPAVPVDPVVYSKNKRAYRRAKKNASAPASCYNFTDPDSGLMMDGATKSITQAYNAQAAVDDQAQIIVAAVITLQVNDRHQLSPMLAAVEANTGSKPELTTADTGYWDSETIAAVEKKGFTVLVPPESQPGGELTASSPLNPVADAMRARLTTETGRAQYGKRQGTVEPVFGNIKQARGYRQFALRGKTKVTAEWQIICLTHNLRKLGRHRQGCNKNDGATGAVFLASAVSSSQRCRPRRFGPKNDKALSLNGTDSRILASVC